MLEHYLVLGDTEIANSARLAAYLDSVGSPLDSAGACGCETFTAALVGDAPYTTPEEDFAPWYDPDVPASADFAGLMVLSVDGLDDHPVQRTVTRSAAGSSVLGPARVLPRTITVTAVLLGATCCAVDYGLRWLAQALAGTTGAGCGGDCLTLFNCCPPEAEEDPAEFAAAHRRTLRRVALVDGPRIVARAGTGCSGRGGCTTGADLLTVEFVLTAATPWAWSDPVPVLDVDVPTDDGTECITWCVHRSITEPVDPVCLVAGDACPPGSVVAELTDTACELAWPDRESLGLPCDEPCRLAACPDMDDLCGDPGCRIPAPPVAPPPETCFCSAIAVNSAAYELDLTGPVWFGAAPLITVEAGSRPLRRLTVTFFERGPEHAGMSCEDVATLERCNPHSVFEVAYVPVGGTLTLDGQVERAMVECAGSCESSSDAYGRDGGPLTFPLLRSAAYCVLVEADAIATPADDARVSIAVSGREY